MLLIVTWIMVAADATSAAPAISTQTMRLTEHATQTDRDHCRDAAHAIAGGTFSTMPNGATVTLYVSAQCVAARP